MHNSKSQKCLLFLLTTLSVTALFAGCDRAKFVTIRGQVIDDETREPVADADICFNHTFVTGFGTSRHDDYRTATVDSDGRFEFRRVKVKDRKSFVHFCAIKDGYDWTDVSLGNATDVDGAIEVRLERDRDVRLPQGAFRIEHEAIVNSDEPTFRFVFREDKLALANDDEQGDFELHFKYQPVDDRTDKMLGCTYPSKSGHRQFPASVTSTGGIRKLVYKHEVGHPPRLPDLRAVRLLQSFSFDQPRLNDLSFPRNHEFLLRTHDGKYALLHFGSGDSFEWVYQPDGSLDIGRRRKSTPGKGHCWKCDFVVN